MAEKDANDSPDSLRNHNTSNSPDSKIENTENTNAATNERNLNIVNEPINLDVSSSSFESSSKKEENPFSFKKFLNQDSSLQINKGARKKVYTPSSMTSANLDLQGPSRSQPEITSRIVKTTDVLPDFVQDHLVVEQCYLSNGSAINIDNLNLQSLPDLNLEHQNIQATLSSNRNVKTCNQSSNQLSSNLPDFTLGSRNYSSVSGNTNNNVSLPDFTMNASSLDSVSEMNVSFINKSCRRRLDGNDSTEASHSNRQRGQMSSSPSVPLDLPSYESNNESNPSNSIPFDLTVPAEEKNNGSRGISAPETVSKSLPDFLSDGPIQKQLDENVRGNPSIPNCMPYEEVILTRLENERLIREIDSLRIQLSDKNRRLQRLESELEHHYSTDQRETAKLEYAFQEVEKNLKLTTKRAVYAEDMVIKLKEENKLLKSELCSIRSNNTEFRIRNCEPQPSSSEEGKNHRIAKELRAAANLAETSLRSLLGGIENLRMIASSMENVNKFEDEEYQHFLGEDSASGPAL